MYIKNFSNISQVTTEDLKATCANHPNDAAAWECAIELMRRVGKNEYSANVFSKVVF